MKEDVSQKERIAYDKVLYALERQITATVDWSQYLEVWVLGLDKIVLKNGHRDFVIMNVRLADERLVILGVLAERQKDGVVEFLRGIPKRLSLATHTVCCDIWEGYTEAEWEELKSVRIVINRFHVAKSHRAAADSMREQELMRSRHELAEEEYQQLKGSTWAFRKNLAS